MPKCRCDPSRTSAGCLDNLLWLFQFLCGSLALAFGQTVSTVEVNPA